MMATKKAPEGWSHTTFAKKQHELGELLKESKLFEASAREAEKKLDVNEPVPVAETQRVEE